MIFEENYAEIAQLVEHNLAKVGVASSSLVFRSKRVSDKLIRFFLNYRTRTGGPLRTVSSQTPNTTLASMLSFLLMVLATFNVGSLRPVLYFGYFL